MKKTATSKKSRTDWKRVDALKDDDIDLSDVPEVSPEMFARGRAARTQARAAESAVDLAR